jgi:acyl carrier protein
MTESESRRADCWTATADLSTLDTLLDGGYHAVRLAPRDGEPAGEAHLLSLVADQWVRGVDLDFTAVHAENDIRRVPLPTHRFERRRHWVDPGDQATVRPEQGTDRLVARLSPDDPAHNAGLITDYLVEEIGKVLGGRHLVATDTSFFGLGLESLALIEIATKLGEELDFEVPATSFMVFPTIPAYVDNLVRLMGSAPAA